MTNTNSKQAPNKGFTLIELSIVLVIIGLIVGGILVGQDLIKAAELRATVSQKEKFDAAVNTFRGKFNGLPGDLANFANFAGTLTQTGLVAGTNGFGDGDGLIEGVSNAVMVGFVGEIKMFFKHLSDAGLIGENLAGVTTAVGADLTTPATYYPAAKLGKGSYFSVGAVTGLNYFVLGGISDASAAAGADFIITSSDVITPSEAYQIDTKLDDGQPATGIVLSIDTIATMATAPAGGAAGAGNCYNSTTGIYSTAVVADANNLLCVLRIRASF